MRHIMQTQAIAATAGTARARRDAPASLETRGFFGLQKSSRVQNLLIKSSIAWLTTRRMTAPKQKRGSRK
jgi:hypothetical protein